MWSMFWHNASYVRLPDPNLFTRTIPLVSPLFYQLVDFLSVVIIFLLDVVWFSKAVASFHLMGYWSLIHLGILHYPCCSIWCSAFFCGFSLSVRAWNKFDGSRITFSIPIVSQSSRCLLFSSQTYDFFKLLWSVSILIVLYWCSNCECSSDALTFSAFTCLSSVSTRVASHMFSFFRSGVLSPFFLLSSNSFLRLTTMSSNQVFSFLRQRFSFPIWTTIWHSSWYSIHVSSSAIDWSSSVSVSPSTNSVMPMRATKLANSSSSLSS